MKIYKVNNPIGLYKIERASFETLKQAMEYIRNIEKNYEKFCRFHNIKIGSKLGYYIREYKNSTRPFCVTIYLLDGEFTVEEDPMELYFP